MSESVLKKFEELIAIGNQITPLGGFEFSGYNARLQNKYLEWRKGCLELLEQSGPIGFPYKNKVLGDQNGGFFFQSSAQLILNGIKELYDKLKASPELAGSNVPSATLAAAQATALTADSGGVRVLRPPQKPAVASQAAAQQSPPVATISPATSISTVGKKVYVISEANEPLRAQVQQLLAEIGLEEVALNRSKGTMLSLEEIKDRPDIQFAFFICSSEDLTYAMFELGHFVGKLGKGHVCVLHMADVNFPKVVPGVSIKPIVVKLEESTLSIMRELKAVGYKLNV
jgi:hypothetical protein